LDVQVAASAEAAVDLSSAQAIIDRRARKEEEDRLTRNEMGNVLNFPSPVLQRVPARLDGELDTEVHVRRVDDVDRWRLGEGEDTGLDGLDCASGVDLRSVVDVLSLLQSMWTTPSDDTKRGKWADERPVQRGRRYRGEVDPGEKEGRTAGAYAGEGIAKRERAWSNSGAVMVLKGRAVPIARMWTGIREGNKDEIVVRTSSGTFNDSSRKTSVETASASCTVSIKIQGYAGEGLRGSTRGCNPSCLRPPFYFLAQDGRRNETILFLLAISMQLMELPLRQLHAHGF
jgi:hypothetical protein